jgi:hypothetical protein
MKRGNVTFGLLAALAALCLGHGGPARAQAIVFTMSQAIPVDTVLTACNGETVHVTGTANCLEHTTVSADGHFVFDAHMNYQGVTGVGLTTGAQYRVQTVDDLMLIGPVPFIITSVLSVQLIGQGSVPNLTMHATFHLVVNPNGTSVFTVDNFTGGCPS